MRDPFGRRITYLRLSVTDRCDLRCVYCMAEDMTFLPRRDLLGLEELERLCDSFISLGVEKIRITGGEPLVRKNVLELFRFLGRRLQDGSGLKEVTLTTNGTRLEQFAASLADCGVRRINVSLDTLRPDRFRAISRRGDLEPVLAGIRAAANAGLKVKINTVALRGVNEDELFPLVDWCGQHGHDLTFIETMPMGDISGHRADQYWPLSELRASLEQRYHLDDLHGLSTGGPARYVRCRESGGKIGFITPMTYNFCEGCNRVRVTCTGRLYMCLGQDDAADLRTPLREFPADDQPLRTAIAEAIRHKPKGHDFIIDRATLAPSVSRHMSVTGG